MRIELNIRLDFSGPETKFTWQLAGAEVHCAALEMVLQAAIGRRVGELLPRLLADHGGGGIADYLAFHFESTPELGIIVPNGHVMCSDYFGSVVVPRLLFFGLLRCLVQAHLSSGGGTVMESAFSRLHELEAAYQEQGVFQVVEETEIIAITFFPAAGILPLYVAPHLIDELREASMTLADPFSAADEPAHAAARLRFVQALRRAGLLESQLPAWLVSNLPSAEASEIMAVVVAYHRLLALVDHMRRQGISFANVSDLRLGLDWFLRVGEWVDDDARAIEFSAYLLRNAHLEDLVQTITWEGWVIALEIGETGFGQVGWVGATCIDQVWEDEEEVGEQYS